MSSKVIKLTWSEVAEMVRTELRKIIGRDVFCVAKSDDDIYWDISFPLERLPLSDLHRILEALDATDKANAFYGEFRENGIFCYGECAYAVDETLDEYLARVGMPKSRKYPIGVTDIVDADEWLSKNDISIGKESNSWHEQIDTYIDDLDGEDVLVSVDYHM